MELGILNYLLLCIPTIIVPILFFVAIHIIDKS